MLYNIYTKHLEEGASAPWICPCMYVFYIYLVGNYLLHRCQKEKERALTTCNNSYTYVQTHKITIATYVHIIIL